MTRIYAKIPEMFAEKSQEVRKKESSVVLLGLGGGKTGNMAHINNIAPPEKEHEISNENIDQ